MLNADTVPTLQTVTLRRVRGWDGESCSHGFPAPSSGLAQVSTADFSSLAAPPQPLGVLSKSCTSDINGRQLWQRNY